jgi:hypothetical protein
VKSLAYLPLALALVSCTDPSSPVVRDTSRDAAPRARELTDEVRKELLDARETAWRAFFQPDQAHLERILGPELIAIQQSEEKWQDRDRLLRLAKGISEQGVQIMRLEFPRTEIQLFGDTAILYYTYIFETGAKGRSVVDEGRGTEVFVYRDGRWVDVGWHLDNGPFFRRNEQWVRAD